MNVIKEKVERVNVPNPDDIVVLRLGWRVGGNRIVKKGSRDRRNLYEPCFSRYGNIDRKIAISFRQLS
jgi:hypothetical protein